VTNIRQDIARRIAARLLRANEAGVISLGDRQRPECVRALTVRFVTPGLRTELAAQWRQFGRALQAADWTDPRPVPTLDPIVDRLLEVE